MQDDLPQHLIPYLSLLRYYEPKGWGKVVSLAAIPSNLYFVVGYEHGSIRIWMLSLDCG